MKDYAVKVLSQKGENVIVSDLYKLNFKAVADQKDFKQLSNTEYFNYLEEQKHASLNNTFSQDIVLEQQKVVWAELIIFQFPMWWGEAPAILKGWFDRILTKGFAYDSNHVYNHGLLRGKRAMLSFTTGGNFDNYGDGKIKGVLSERLFNIQHETLYFCGLNIIEPFIVWGNQMKNESDRETTLCLYYDRLVNISSNPLIPFQKVEEYN